MNLTRLHCRADGCVLPHGHSVARANATDKSRLDRRHGEKLFLPCRSYVNEFTGQRFQEAGCEIYFVTFPGFFWQDSQVP